MLSPLKFNTAFILKLLQCIIAITLKTIDATKRALNAGNPQAMNVVMLGALSKYMPLREEIVIEALSESVPAKFMEVNMRAFELGMNEVGLLFRNVYLRLYELRNIR